MRRLSGFVVLAVSVFVLVQGCSSGSGSGGGGGFCARATELFNRCGFGAYASSGDFKCEEPSTETQSCVYECELKMTCTELVAVLCNKDIGPLQSCLNKCPQGFKCASGETVSDSSKCDGYDDCADGSDETGCPTFQCDDGSTVSLGAKCDGYSDCADGSDESTSAGCPAPFDCGDGTTVPQSYKCDGYDDCSNGADEQAGCPAPFNCGDGTTTLPSNKCDGVADCVNGADEQNCPPDPLDQACANKAP